MATVILHKMETTLNNVLFVQKVFIINEHKEILVLKRSEDNYFKGLWDIPGGKTDEEGPLLEALTTKVHAETGLNVTRVIVNISTAKFRGIITTKPLIIRNFYLALASGTVKLSSEHSEYKWVKPAELADLAFPPDPDFQSSLLKVAEVINSLDLGKRYSLLF